MAYLRVRTKVIGDFRIQGIFGESCQWGGGHEEGSVSAISKQLRGSGKDTEKLACVPWNVREYLKNQQRRDCLWLVALEPWSREFCWSWAVLLEFGEARVFPLGQMRTPWKGPNWVLLQRTLLKRAIWRGPPRDGCDLPETPGQDSSCCLGEILTYWKSLKNPSKCFRRESIGI